MLRPISIAKQKFYNNDLSAEAVTAFFSSHQSYNLSAGFTKTAAMKIFVCINTHTENVGYQNQYFYYCLVAWLSKKVVYLY